MNSGSKPPDYSGGPVWAVFDSDAVEREGWKVTPPYVDPDGYFFTAGTLADLAAAIENPWQAVPMSGAALEATVRRYNGFVDSGIDEDFGKPSPKYKIQTPPFHAAWGTPLVHDSRAGLRINEKCQVLDMNGQVIPGLYCGGESAGGFNQHGMGRCTVQGLDRRQGGGGGASGRPMSFPYILVPPGNFLVLPRGTVYGYTRKRARETAPQGNQEPQRVTLQRVRNSAWPMRPGHATGNAARTEYGIRPKGMRLSIQAKGRRAKGYQVRQFLRYREEEAER